MGSVGNTSPWAPYNTYKDCSQEICSIYCPQYCYLIFPPPPADNGNSTPFSPLIIAVISVLASALLLVIYYTFVTRFCRGRGRGGTTMVVEDDHEELVVDPCHVGSTGLDEAVIKMITVRKYKKGEMEVGQGSECAVCLSEFQENEALRVLPKCDHMFHLPCIDTWLASSSVCPLCRAKVVALVPHPLTHRSPLHENSHDHNGDHTILVVDNQESRRADENGLGRDHHDCIPCEIPCLETRNEVSGSYQNRVVTWVRRSKSLGTFSYMQKVSSSYVKLEENCTGYSRSPGGSKELGVKRSFSTGKLMLKCGNKGKDSLLPY